MTDEKTQKIYIQIYTALVAVMHVALGIALNFVVSSDSRFLVHMRWQARREAYEAKLVNSLSGMPGYWRVFTRVHESLGNIFDALLIIVFGSALITTVANTTTGSAAKNGNVTASPGAAAIIQLLPFIFVAIIAFSAFDLLRSRSKGL